MPRTALAIRLGTFCAGVALVCLAMLGLTLNLRTDAALAAPAIVASWIATDEAAWADTRRSVQIAKIDNEGMTATITDGDGDEGALSLWIFQPEGSVALLSAEQFQRCLAARRMRREEAGCPPSPLEAQNQVGGALK